MQVANRAPLILGARNRRKPGGYFQCGMDFAETDESVMEEYPSLPNGFPTRGEDYESI